MGHTVSRSTVTSQLNDMTANILTNITMNCSSLSYDQQVISINCTPINQLPFEANATCRQCISDILTAKKEEYARYLNLAQSKKLNPDSIPNINLDMHYVAEALRSCGKRVCKACVIENISQSNVVNASIDCQATNNIQNKVSQSLTNAILQKLSTNYDVLGSLANIIGASDAQSISNEVSSRVKRIVTNTLITNINAQVKGNQMFVINATSGQFNGITQHSTYNSIVTYLATNNIFNSILSDSEWKTLQTLHDTNDLTGELAQRFLTVNTVFADVLKHSMKYVVLVVMICMCLAAFYVIGVTIMEYRNQSMGLAPSGKKATPPATTTPFAPLFPSSSSSSSSTPQHTHRRVPFVNLFT